MVFCHYCGCMLPDDAVFCNKCGGKVALTAPSSPSSKVTTEFGQQSQSPEQTQAGSGYQPTIPAWPSSQPSYPPQQPMGPQPQWTMPVGPSVQQGQQLAGSQTSFILPPPPISQPSPQTVWPSQPGTLQSMPSPQSLVPPGSYSQPGWQPSQMPAAAPQPAPPPSAMQRLLLNIFKPALAGNAVLGIILGSIIALVAGAATAGLLEAIAHAVAPSLARFVPGGQDIMDYLLGITPLHAPFRDSLQLFFTMHGVAAHTQYVSGSIVSSYAYNATLNGLLIIPALALTFGGYIAASTDFQNRAANCLWRGAAIAVPYAVLLIILVPQVNGSIPLSSGAPSTDTYTLTIDMSSLFIFGLLWGALFGLLGASLKLGRGQWRHMVFQFLRIMPRPQIGGMVAGGLAATSLGLALAFLVLLSILAYSTYSVPLFTTNLCYYNLGFGNWQYLSAWGIAQGPLHAMNLFFYSFGAPVSINNPLQSQYGQCLFYTSSAQAKLSMFGGSSHLPSWTYALLALPVISLFLGGRVSASIARSQGVGPGAIQGALIALPFTILMMLLSVITTITIQSTNPSNSSSLPTSIVQSAGVGAFDMALWALLSGAILGALGGMYQCSALKTDIAKGIHVLTAPIRLLAKPGYFLIDRLRGHPPTARHTTALDLLYAAVMASIFLAIAVGVAAVVLIGLNQTITLDSNHRIRDIMGVLIIAVPGLLLLSAGSSALTEDPTLEVQNTMPVSPGATMLPGMRY